MPNSSSPVFLIEIVHAGDGTIARFPGGGPIEAEIIDLFTNEIMMKGVGYKSSSHVEQDVRDGIEDALMKLKKQTRYLI